MITSKISQSTHCLLYPQLLDVVKLEYDIHTSREKEGPSKEKS